MNESKGNLKKTLEIRPRYKNTKAYAETMCIIKSCGNIKFYKYFCDKIRSNADNRCIEGLRAFLDNLDYLTPKPTNIDRTTCLEAKVILDEAVDYVAKNGFNKSIVFEELNYHQQVYFSLMGMFNILSMTQKLEENVQYCENNNNEILAKHRMDELKKLP